MVTWEEHDSIVLPDSLSITEGTLSAGDLTGIEESDEVDVSIRRRATDIQSRTAFTITGFSPVANPISLGVTLEGSVFARTTVIQSIELWNYQTGDWELIDTRTAQRFTDLTATIVVTGDPSRFVETGTLGLMARVQYRSLNARQQFSSHTDHFQWTIE